MKCFSCVQLFATPWTEAYQAPPSMELSRQDTGVGCHFLLQGIFLTQRLNPGLLHCRQTLYHLIHWEAKSKTPGKYISEDLNLGFTTVLP